MNPRLLNQVEREAMARADAFDARHGRNMTIRDRREAYDTRAMMHSRANLLRIVVARGASSVCYDYRITGAQRLQVIRDAIHFARNGRVSFAAMLLHVTKNCRDLIEFGGDDIVSFRSQVG